AAGPGSAPGGPGPAPGGPATTRNGLVKRQPREGALRRPARPPAPAPPPAEPERSPDEVRTMLNAFRSGVQRAGQGTTGEPQ
ncbi:hypothetical protein ACRYCC_43735, partial [Actinomadura scrupuli]